MLLESTDSTLDLSGDSGTIGRLRVHSQSSSATTPPPHGEHALTLDLKGKVFDVPAGATVKFVWTGPHAVSELLAPGCDFEGATYIGDQSGVTITGEPGEIKSAAGV